MAQLLILFAALLWVPLAHARPPHIVIILADDMGYSDIACYGGEVRTPHLDALAQGGLRFTQFYNTGRCCPTRAALLTGLYPHQAGIGHMVRDSGQPGYIGRLNDSSVTIAEVLRAGGYRTGAFGKWHVTHFDYDTGKADHRDSWPLQRGFDRFVGSLAGGGNYYGPKGWMEGNEFKRPGKDFYYTDAVSDAAVDFIATASDDRPLFMYVAYTAPHWPLHAHQEDIAKYEGVYQAGWDVIREERYQRMLKMGLIDKGWKLSPRDNRVAAWDGEAADCAWRSHQMATYAAMIDRMDQGIGRILKALDDTERGADTLLLFLSDNGGCEENVRMPGIRRFASPDQDTSRWGNRKDVMAGSPDTFQSYAIPWANASNTPYRWYKSEVHEGGISTPLVVHWPTGIKQALRGSLVKDPGHVIDLMATCVDVAQGQYPRAFKRGKVQPMEGASLLPALSGAVIRRDQPLFFAHEGNRAVRDGKWKLVKLREGAWELYDLEADRSELNNLAAHQPKRVKRMAGIWQTWAKRADVVPGPFDK